MDLTDDMISELLEEQALLYQEIHEANTAEMLRCRTEEELKIYITEPDSGTRYHLGYCPKCTHTLHLLRKGIRIGKQKTEARQTKKKKSRQTHSTEDYRSMEKEP